MIFSLPAMAPCPSPLAAPRFSGPAPPLWRTALLCCLLALMAGACAPQPQVTGPAQEPFAALSARLRSQALAWENSGEPRQALLRWMILQSLNPRDRQIAARVEKLKAETRAKAAGHFQQGVAFYQQNRVTEARREFLLALTYEQDHAEALDYLRNRLPDKVFITYQVQEGDACREIARRLYRDPGKEFLIPAFNNVDGSCQPQTGTALKLVVLDQVPGGGGPFVEAVAEPERKGVPVLAPGRQKSKVMEDAYNAGPADPADEPSQLEGGGAGPNARKYAQARELLERKKVVEALGLLRTLDPHYRDVAKLVATTEAFIQQKADAHYRKGISYYLSEDLDQAIREWEEVLKLRPDDLKARKDLLNARRLKEKIKKF
ncbi:MAG: tetratricopeptide repeat protein [Thermodesulfobacteriota bacterium]